MDAYAANPLEVISSVLLALAAVASAWCAYQSALWNGEQLERLGEASNSQFESTSKLAIVNRNFTIDVVMFMNYVIADVHGDAKVAQFLRSNVRPELAPALEAWLQDVAAGKPDPPNPFLRPQYHPLGNDDAARLAGDAAAKLAAGRAAIVNSALFMLHTVMISMALFFLGETNIVHRLPAKLSMLILGGAALAASVLSVRRVPRLKPPPRPPRPK
ncbi:MAG TPA: hypothetical protein VHK47_16160 [Polyangia bacterium]|jgi:hypothetical protein|nr:hypothetical protein [Polyangia bacterium]